MLVLQLLSLCLVVGTLPVYHAAPGAAAPGNERAMHWNVTVLNTKNDRLILDQVFGTARVGRMHAIMGPSGSGKTSLLNFLAGEVNRGVLQVTGSLSLPSLEAGNSLKIC